MSFVKNKQMFKLGQTALLGAIFVTFIILMNYPSYYSLSGGLLTPFNSTTWIGFSIILLVAFVPLVLFGRIKISTIHLGYLGCLILLLVPLLYSDTTFLKYEYMTILGIIATLSLIFLTSQYSDKNFKRSLLLILFASSLIQSAWGFIQYYFIFESNLLFVLAESNQPVGIFNQINVFSTYLNLGSLLALYFLFTAKKQTKLLIIFTLFVLIMNAHLNVLAISESGRVVSLIAIGLYLSYFACKRSAYSLPICLLLISIACSFMPKQWFDVRPNQIVDTPIVAESLGFRPIIYMLSIDLVAQEPLTGFGIGKVRKEFAFKVGEYRQEFSDYNGLLQISHVHNEILQWLIQLGVTSALAFLGIFGIWVWGLRSGNLEPSILLLALPFVGHSLLEFPFYASAPHLLAFALILGLAIKVPLKKVTINKRLGLFTIPLIAIISIQTINVMLASVASSAALTEYHRGGSKNIELLESVSPPVSFALHYKIEKFEWTLDNGFKTGKISQDDIFSFIAWAEDIKEYWPINKVYIRLAQSYIIAQDMQAANGILDEALFLFADDPEVIRMVMTMKQVIGQK